MKRSIRFWLITIAVAIAANLCLCSQAHAQSPAGAPYITPAGITFPLQNPPPVVTSVSVSRVGNPGQRTISYWIVVNTLLGQSPVAGPFTLTQAASVYGFGSQLASGTYTSGITATGTTGQTCTLTAFNNGSTATATVALTSLNTIATGTALVITSPGTGATAAPTSATAGNGTATCSGTATVATVLGANNTAGATVSWSPVSGSGITYDLLRTLGNTPTGACGCAVATGLTTPSYTDTVEARTAYTVAPVNAGSLAITLSNQATGLGTSALTENGFPFGGSFINSLTTIGSSGPATVASGVLNVPQYTGSTLNSILPGWTVTGTGLGQTVTAPGNITVPNAYFSGPGGTLIGDNGTLQIGTSSGYTTITPTGTGIATPQISVSGSITDTSIPASTSPLCPNGPGGAFTTIGCTPSGGTPGLPQYSLQFNYPSGTFAGSSQLTYNPASGAGVPELVLAPAGNDYGAYVGPSDSGFINSTGAVNRFVTTNTSRYPALGVESQNLTGQSIGLLVTTTSLNSSVNAVQSKIHGPGFANSDFVAGTDVGYPVINSALTQIYGIIGNGVLSNSTDSVNQIDGVYGTLSITPGAQVGAQSAAVFGDDVSAIPGAYSFYSMGGQNQLQGPLNSGPVTSPEATVSQLATPTGVFATTATTGGTIPASTTIYARVAAYDATASSPCATTPGAGYSMAAAELSQITGSSTSTNTITWAWNVVPFAAGYCVYTGSSSGAEALLATVPRINNNSYTQTSVGSPSGSLPTANTTGNATISGNLRSGLASNTDLTGRITLSAGSGSRTLVGNYASPPNCLAADVTTPGFGVTVSESTTTLTFTGEGSDTIKYLCIGRN